MNFYAKRENCYNTVDKIVINFSHFSIILVKFLMILRLSLGEYIILLIKIITLHLRDIKCNSEKAMAPHSSTLA